MREAVGGGGLDRLSKEIFSILESNFVRRRWSRQGRAQPGVCACSPSTGDARRGRAGQARAPLQELSWNPEARVADYFDMAAESGASGCLVAALFAR